MKVSLPLKKGTLIFHQSAQNAYPEQLLAKVEVFNHLLSLKCLLDLGHGDKSSAELHWAGVVMSLFEGKPANLPGKEGIFAQVYGPKERIDGLLEALMNCRRFEGFIRCNPHSSKPTLTLRFFTRGTRPFYEEVFDRGTEYIIGGPVGDGGLYKINVEG